MDEQAGVLFTIEVTVEKRQEAKARSYAITSNRIPSHHHLIDVDHHHQHGEVLTHTEHEVAVELRRKGVSLACARTLLGAVRKDVTYEYLATD